MKPDEAREWLTGERSTWNEMMSVEGDPSERQQTMARTDEADAARMQQAYWLLRAKAEGLTA